MNQNLMNTESVSPFDRIRKLDAQGQEYWEARELQGLLGYTEWRKFEDSIERAKISCENNQQAPSDHFVHAAKMINTGKGAKREVKDYHLSRYGCYLTAMNGDPRKKEVSAAQSYFAIQTRKAEIAQVQAKEQKKERIFTQDVRRRCIENEKSIPDGYWCVVTEMWREAWSLESFMKELQPSRLPDGSCGRKWRQYLNEVHHPLLGKSYHYPLSAPHHQGRVEMWIYPMDLLYEFRCWLRREYAEYYDTKYSPSRVIDAPMKQVRGGKKKGELPPGGEK